MSIDIKEVKHIAKLAKLSFNENELGKMAEELDDIVKYVEQLKELDLKDVPATSHVLDLTNIFRKDIALPALPVEKVLQNAPAQKMGYFSMPKVIG